MTSGDCLAGAIDRVLAEPTPTSAGGAIEDSIMANPRVLGMIMAGGRGERLEPLTRERSKPAVPFGGKYRIVDFVLSNFINSGIYSQYLLVQYKSQSLIEHLRVGWRHEGLSKEQFITVVPSGTCSVLSSIVIVGISVVPCLRLLAPPAEVGVGLRKDAVRGPSEAAAARHSASLASNLYSSLSAPCPLGLRDTWRTPHPSPPAG